MFSPKLAGVLGRAPFAYLAVETSSGPHVTPLLFGVTAPNRVWFGIGRRTLKARALAKRPAVGVVVPGDTASVVIRGGATLLDGSPKPSVAAVQAPFAVPACLCVDESNGAGPLAKRGTLLRGTGRARLRGELATVQLAADRITRWRGFDTDTAPVTAEPRRTR
jgi:Pyridoxamine 5'-phosphate oxidase